MTNDETLTAKDFLRQAAETAKRWCWTVDAIMENQKYGQGKEDPIPGWAIERLAQPHMGRAGVDEFDRLVELLTMAIDISEGSSPRWAYEVWTKRTGHRLEGQFIYRQHAEQALSQVHEQFPDAFIARINPKGPQYAYSEPALLDTLIGKVWLCGTTFADEQNEAAYTIQDDTGRTVTVKESVLRAHPVFDRMSPEAQSRVSPRLTH